MSQPPKQIHRKRDGRELVLYGNRPGADARPGRELEPVPKPQPHLRWHPLRREYVAYATHRQARTFKPPREYCPLCPAHREEGAESFPGEIPYSDFEIAVFENRFPGFHSEPGAPPDIPGVATAQAAGRCEVVVYCAEHQGSLAELSAGRRELLLDVWADRYAELYRDERIQYVMPFENRGEAVGVTLHHPHGQIYGFPFIPPVIKTMAEAFTEGDPLDGMLAHGESSQAVWGDANAVAAVPPYARFPYETWVMPRRRVAGPGALTDAERTSMAQALGEASARLDRLFGKPMPYIMIVQAAPKGYEASFHFHVAFQPFLRTADKLKYLAGCEQGAGIFLVDVAPDAMAEALRHA